ncbi:MAG: SDR family oxidoreductase [Candidatus Nitrosopolaris sp.]|jgi:NAD(P)-dependent dehydrogenase (short-subunit alcohol dehydrogenase family)
MTSNQRVAVVTGSSSGNGYETSLTLARNGFLTYATMRNLNKSENIKSLAEKEKLPLKIVQLDVTDDRSVNNAMQSITAESNRIDVLVNNAGYPLSGAFEDLGMEEIKAQYETNLFGVIRVTQAVLPIMRKQKSGIIVNISSVAGRFGFSVLSAYSSTKFAVEGLSESMAYELEPFGIKVVLVEPGFIRTNIVNSTVVAKKSQDPNSPYSQLMQNMATSFEHLMQVGSSPDVVAKVVLKAVTSENPSLRYLAGKDAEDWMEAKRSMSDEEFYKMMKQNLVK